MTPNKDGKKLRRAEIRKIFEDHRGATANLARQLGVSHNAVRFVLTGKLISPRILTAATNRAEELLAEAPRDESAAVA
jgi:predicted ArsR family transcriptional regulator